MIHSIAHSRNIEHSHRDGARRPAPREGTYTAHRVGWTGKEATCTGSGQSAAPAGSHWCTGGSRWGLWERPIGSFGMKPNVKIIHLFFPVDYPMEVMLKVGPFVRGQMILSDI